MDEQEEQRRAEHADEEAGAELRTLPIGQGHKALAGGERDRDQGEGQDYQGGHAQHGGQNGTAPLFGEAAMIGGRLGALLRGKDAMSRGQEVGALIDEMLRAKASTPADVLALTVNSQVMLMSLASKDEDPDCVMVVAIGLIERSIVALELMTGMSASTFTADKKIQAMN